MLEVKTRPQDARHPVAAGKDPVEVAVIEITRRRKRNVCQSRLFDAAAKPAAGENHNGPAVQPELSADGDHRRHMACQRRTAQQDTGHPANLVLPAPPNSRCCHKSAIVDVTATDRQPKGRAAERHALKIS